MSNWTTLTNLHNTPWLLSKDFFQCLLQASSTNQFDQVKAMAGITQQDLSQENGGKSIAVLPISGPITKGHGGIMSLLFGGTSSDALAAKFTEMVEDDAIEGIILKINSPGGEVAGTQEFAKTIFQARGQKPIVTFADGMMASAAYWIGAAADRVYVSGENNPVGSIGVVASHVDTSKLEESVGVKVTEIIAGKYKRVGSQHAPLSSDDRTIIQDRIDAIYSNFVKDVAEFRGKKDSFVLDRMADGRIFLGQDAVERELADGIKSFSEVASEVSGNNHSTEAFAMSKENEKALTEQDITAAYQKGLEEGKALGVKEGMTAGAEAERARIQSVEEQAMEGHEDLIASLKFDGKTTGEMAAVQILKAEKSAKAQHLASIHGDTPGQLPSAQIPTSPSVNKEDQKEALIEAKMKEAGCSYENAAIEVSKTHRELFLHG